MTIREAYIEQMKVCQAKGLDYDSGHYKTRIKYEGKSVYVSPDGGDVISFRFDITGCIKHRLIKKDGKVVKVLHFHKDKLPVYGTITRRRALKGLLYKYLLFLRCDGIENRDLLNLYVLHCLANKLEYWRKKPVISNGIREEVVTKYEDWELYEPDYEDVEKMVKGLIDSACKKEIDDKTREQFIVRSRCVVNPDTVDEYGGIRKKTSAEKHRDAKRGQRMATDNKIWSLYDPVLKDQENARKIGVSVRRFREWKADNRENLESLKNKITRLYDPSLSWSDNATTIGCSVNTIKKYVGRMEAISAVEEKDDSWIDKAVEEHTPSWEDAPATKQIRNEEFEEMMELLESIVE